MPLVVENVKLEDFDVMSQCEYLNGGDLAAPVVPAGWPHSKDAASMTARTRWSMRQQRDMFLVDPTVHFMKVVDTDNNDNIIALARWHYYEAGYKYEDMLPWELNGTAGIADEDFPPEMNLAAFKDFVTPILSSRSAWQGQRPMWILTTLITKESERRRGAGGMLVKWGVDQAVANGVPAFIEAGPLGRPQYEKFGFKSVGTISIDMSKHGWPESRVLHKMAANLAEEAGAKP